MEFARLFVSSIEDSSLYYCQQIRDMLEAGLATDHIDANAYGYLMNLVSFIQQQQQQQSL
jgi:flagellar biosynthesis chaperone FliJ